MSDKSVDRYAELLRRDFTAFVHRSYLELYPSNAFESNWHVEVIAEKLEAVLAGKIRRLIINVPPRNLKSILGSVVFPAFVLGHKPSAEVLCTSYTQDVANGFALPCRQLMSSDFYKSLFPTRLSDERQAVEEFRTTAGGVRRAVSWAGSLMGRGADYLIIDDPLQVEGANSEQRRAKTNEEYHSSVATRLNRESGAVILIMQRLHHNDLSAFVQKSEPWDVLALPALAEENEEYFLRNNFGNVILRREQGEALQPQRYSADSLLKLKSQRGSEHFDAQYQQRPHGAEGTLVPREWLKFYDTNSIPTEFESKIQSWDTASKGGEDNSYSVCTTWGIKEDQLYLLDCYRGRPDFRKLKVQAIALAAEHRPTTILVEDQSSGSALQQELAALGLPAEAVAQTAASKIERLQACINRFEAGRIHLPRRAPWLESYVEELTTFPDSDFNDQVDSTTQAITWSGSNTNKSFQNAMEYLRLAGGQIKKPSEKVRIRVLEGGGEMQFHDGSGRASITIPPTGSIMEIDKDLLRYFLPQFKRFQIVND